MRKIKHGSSNYTRYLNNVPKGVCDLCGGKGRYKETFSYKNPIIHHCYKCKGTGNVQIKVKYIGETDFSNGLWKDSDYGVVTETELSYIITVKNSELVEIKKELFEEYN